MKSPAFDRRLSGIAWLVGFAAAGCGPTSESIRLARENESLRRETSLQQRTLADRDGSVATLRKQVGDLQGFGPDRPITMFAPVKLEIASLSGGADYDGKPGDDGINVYLRPRDDDGDAVKVPGRIKIQVIDNSNLHSPRVIGIYPFDDPGEVRKTWHGKFGTQHFSLKCPFPTGVLLPPSRTLLVSAEFVDLLTGVTLTASQEVKFAVPSP